MRQLRLIAALALAGFVGACDGAPATGALPAPLEPTAESLGYFCGMNLEEHAGPKGQIHLADGSPVIWFTSVRDTLAFTLLPDEAKNFLVVYVNDMARARNWDQPEAGAWVDASAAYFVIGSSRLGGMGAPEAVPFSDPESAADFRGRFGGAVVTLADMPRDFILGEGWVGEIPAGDASGEGGDHGQH